MQILWKGTPRRCELLSLLHEKADQCGICSQKRTWTSFSMAYSGWGCLIAAVLPASGSCRKFIRNRMHSSPQKDSAIDYDAYVGTWFSKEISSMDEFMSGVQLMQISRSMTGHEISLSTVQSAPANQLQQQIKYTGNWKRHSVFFQNDGWMSSGEGRSRC